MTDNSEIAHLIAALTNNDAPVESQSLPASKNAAGACSGARRSTRPGVSRMIEYALITTYVSFAALLFIPPYFATMSRVVSNLLRSF